jgi:hypothetical protein
MAKEITIVLTVRPDALKDAATRSNARYWIGEAVVAAAFGELPAGGKALNDYGIEMMSRSVREPPELKVVK